MFINRQERNGFNNVKLNVRELRVFFGAASAGGVFGAASAGGVCSLAYQLTVL